MNIFQSTDRSVLLFLYNLVNGNPALELIFGVLAVITIYIVPIFLLWVWFSKGDPLKNKLVALEVFLSGMVSWQLLSRLVKTFYFRARPFENSSIGVRELLMHRPDQSFPSDHASLLFGITFALYFFGKKRIANYFLTISIIVSISRIATGLHYFSDILGGVAVGFLGALLVYLLRRPFEKYLGIPLVNISKKVKLS